MNCLINGKAGASIDANDRGLHYGDGIFETLAVLAGRARYFSRHMQRLARGCDCLGLPQPEPEVIAQEIQKLCDSNERAVVKLIVTRGQGQRGYAPPGDPAPTRILLRYPWPAPDGQAADSGVAVRSCSMRLGVNPVLAGIKHLNRLEQVLARSEWTDPRIREGIMYDNDEFLVEGVHSNIFLVSRGRLRTPLLDRCGVAGVMRERILEIAGAAALETECCRLVRDDLVNADEVFLTNTLCGILPVVLVDQQHFPVGAITSRLRELLAGDIGA